MIKKSSVYKAVSVLLFALTLGATAAHAQSSVCPDEANLVSGKFISEGWQTKAHHIVSPILKQVQLPVTGESVVCKYEQVTTSGNKESFEVTKKASSANFPIDYVKESGWGSVQQGVAVCTPSGTNACEFTGLNSQSSVTGDPARCAEILIGKKQLDIAIPAEKDPDYRKMLIDVRERLKAEFTRDCMK